MVGVIAERYAPGYGVDTPIIGWSATKSVTNALIGIIVRQGKLSLDGPAPIAAWADPRDPRHAITLDNLLRMNSGLDIGQSLTAGATEAFDPSAQMVFDERDMAAFAARAPLRARPGTAWNYANGNTLLLSRLIRDQTGGSVRDGARLRPSRAVRRSSACAAATLEFERHRHRRIGARCHYVLAPARALGTLPASSISMTWCRRRQPHPAHGLGRLFRHPDARQRNLRLRRRLLDQPRAAATAPASAPGSASRRTPSWRVAPSGNNVVIVPLGPPSSSCAWAWPSRRATTWKPWAG